MKKTFVCLLLIAALGCAGPAEVPEATSTPSPTEALSEALTFHASFDDGMDAAFAKGDRRIYNAPSYQEIDQRGPGYVGQDIEIASDEGLVGDALRFNKKNVTALFYTAEDNVAFVKSDWSGTVSFWLRLDPATDLEPGFCDPIQVTDTAYNDNAIWVDFTKDNPRSFRLGVFGERDVWNPENKAPDDYPAFEERLVIVSEPPFAADRWTHVAIAFEHLGSPEGRATLYLDGEEQGTSEGISESFAWDMKTAAIRLGVNYVGLYDELSVFNRPLSADEVRALGELEGGVASLY